MLEKERKKGFSLSIAKKRQTFVRLNGRKGEKVVVRCPSVCEHLHTNKKRKKPTDLPTRPIHPCFAANGQKKM
jgi:hypothetical protein